MANANPFNLTDPVLLGNLTDAQRRMALAQSLVDQSQQMPNPARSSGRYVVPNTLEPMVKALQGIQGRKQLERASADEREAMVAALRDQREAEEAEREGLLTPAQVQAITGAPPEAGAHYFGTEKRITKVDRAPRATADSNATPRPKLKPGERFKLDGSDEVEAIPGSDLYKKQADSHAKDAGALDTVTTQTDNAARKIDFILAPENKEGFEAMFGGYNAKLATQYKPGVTQDVKKEVESLKSDLKKAGLDMLRSGGSVGQMTVQEWPIVESAIESIDPLLGEENARTKLEYVKAYLQRIRDNAANVYAREWGGSQFNKAAAPGKPVTPPNAPPGGTAAPGRKIVRTGTRNGKKVVQYDDGSIEEAP